MKVLRVWRTDHVRTIRYEDGLSDHNSLNSPLVSAVASLCNVTLFPPSSQVPHVKISDSREWTGVCCFFVIFLWRVPDCWCEMFWFPVRIYLCHINLARQSEHPWLRGQLSQPILDFSCLKHEPISWKFLRRALELVDWQNLARVSFVSRCLIDAVWNPHSTSRAKTVEPTLEYLLNF